MVKHKKKRKKVYAGSGASVNRPAVTRVTAVNRSKSGQWWFENKRMVRIVSLISGVLFIIILMIIGLASLFV